MKFETLKTIHDLLKKRCLKLEARNKAMKDELDQAYRALEDAENDPDRGPGTVEDVNLNVQDRKRQYPFKTAGSSLRTGRF